MKPLSFASEFDQLLGTERLGGEANSPSALVAAPAAAATAARGLPRSAGSPGCQVRVLTRSAVLSACCLSTSWTDCGRASSSASGILRNEIGHMLPTTCTRPICASPTHGRLGSGGGSIDVRQTNGWAGRRAPFWLFLEKN